MNKTFEKLVEQIKKDTELGKLTLQTCEIKKNNGVILHGIRVLNDTSPATPVLYVDKTLKGVRRRGYQFPAGTGNNPAGLTGFGGKMPIL